MARLSDNQLHYVHTGKVWIASSNINITGDPERSRRLAPLNIFIIRKEVRVVKKVVWVSLRQVSDQ